MRPSPPPPKRSFGVICLLLISLPGEETLMLLRAQLSMCLFALHGPTISSPSVGCPPMPSHFALCRTPCQPQRRGNPKHCAPADVGGGGGHGVEGVCTIKEVVRKGPASGPIHHHSSPQGSTRHCCRAPEVGKSRAWVFAGPFERQFWPFL